MKSWTEYETEQMQKLYPNTSTAEIANLLNRTEKQVYAKAKCMGIKKSKEYLASPAAGQLQHRLDAGMSTRFVKGGTSWNKGQSGLPVNERSIATQFKKGITPHNSVPVGTEVVIDGYLKIKVGEPKQWKFVHRKNWEESNGSIPKGMALIFKDGNRMNCAIENLELLTRKELMSRNTIARFPPELRSTIKLMAKVKRKIEDAANEKQN